MARDEYLFTSESVTEGHPDKIADQISDAVLDAIIRQDPTGRVACETLLTTGLVAAAVQSLAAGQKRLETPHLSIRYQAPRQSSFWLE